MIVECMEEPEEPKKSRSQAVSNLISCSDFDQFVHELGDLNQQNLKFSQCNKFLKLKQIDYMTDTAVVQYFKEIFVKKTSTAVRRKWHIKDKFILVWVIFKLCYRKGIQELKMKYTDWSQVEKILKLPKEFLMRKWICLIRHTTYHFHWIVEQQQTLKKCMINSQMQSKWSDIALEIYKSSGSDVLRTCKDIRQHWKNYLDPRLKKVGWTTQQDSHLIQLVQSHGKKWSLVSKLLEGRTQNQVKNRYLALLKKTVRRAFSSTHHSESDESSLMSSQEEEDVKLQQSFIDNVKMSQDLHLYDTHGSVNDQELQDYIHMSVYKCSMDDGFFNDI